MRKPPPIVVRPSWSETGGLVRLNGRHRTLGEPFVLGAFLSILGIDMVAWIGVQVFGPRENTVCSKNLRFCYPDPVPNIVSDQWIMAVLAAVIVLTVLGSIVLRHGIVVTVLMQTVLAIVLVVQVLPQWADAAQKQNLLRTCHYGASGSCPGIENLLGAAADRRRRDQSRRAATHAAAASVSRAESASTVLAVASATASRS